MLEFVADAQSCPEPKPRADLDDACQWHVEVPLAQAPPRGVEVEARSPGPENATNLAEGEVVVLNVLQHLIGAHEDTRLILKGQPVRRLDQAATIAGLFEDNVAAVGVIAGSLIRINRPSATAAEVENRRAFGKRMPEGREDRVLQRDTPGVVPTVFHDRSVERVRRS